MLADGLARFPDAPDLREWEAALASEDARFEDALVILDDVLKAHPERSWSQLERVAVLIDLGRYGDALTAVRALPRFDDPHERAALHAQEGVCLDHLGDQPAPTPSTGRPKPSHPTTTRCRSAFPRPASKPSWPKRSTTSRRSSSRYLEQVVVRVRDWPGPDDDPSLMGLYVGVARPDRTVLTEDHLDHIVVFKRAHELQAADEDELRDEVRRTVVHEIAHHFGIEHEDMGEEYQ